MDNSEGGQDKWNSVQKVSRSEEHNQQVVDFEAGPVEEVSLGQPVTWVDLKNVSASPLLDALNGLLSQLNNELSSEKARLDDLRMRMGIDV